MAHTESGEEFIEITPDLEVGFSSALMQQYFDDSDAVRFYYDGDEGFVGFRSVEKDADAGDYELIINDDRGWADPEDSNVAYFLDCIGMDLDESTRYEVDGIVDGMLIVELEG
jgi:hypothetical protein